MSQGFFTYLRGVLMTSAIFPVVIMSIRALCTCMRPLNASTSFPGLCAFSGLGFGLLPGEFGFIQPFRGILTHSGFSVGLLKSFSALCTRMYASDVSVWVSSLFGSPTHSSPQSCTR